MNLKQIEAFVKIAENNSFSLTAKELYLTQPTISAHIVSLEKELNVKLFSRTTKEVHLTKDGEKLYKYGKQMMALAHTMETLFDAEDGKSAKTISIAASSIPAQYLLPSLMSKYNEKYPQTRFHLYETDSARVIEAVMDHTIDVGFTGTVIPRNCCRYISVYEDELVIVTPNTEKYQKLTKEDITANWIVSEPLIMRDSGSGTRIETEKILRNSGIDLDKLNIIATIENPEAIKRSVKNGVGITIMSRLAVQEEVNSGELLKFDFNSKSSKRKLNLVYNTSYPLPKSAERLLNLIKDLYNMEEKDVQVDAKK